VSSQRTRKPTPRRHEGAKTSAKGKPAAAKPVKGKPAKRAGARTPASKKRKHAPVGRPDGPLARRRRLRIRVLVLALLVVNVVVGAVWQDWSISLAVLIVSVVTAPLLAAMLLRRRR
jgi:Flp pilus assembly protein TadB